MTDAVGAEILKKLDVLVALTAVSALEGKVQNAQVELLDRAGLSRKDIAKLVGTTPNTVSVTLSKARHTGKKMKKSGV